MNDRFKFRIFDYDDNEMHDVIEIMYREDNTVVEWLNSEDKKRSAFIGEVPIVQSTGLKDKNGKLIYEGDIIKYLSGTVNKKFVKYITKWNDNMGQFYISKINPSEYDNWKDWHLGRHDLDYEVIGNIYLDSHLLEN